MVILGIDPGLTATGYGLIEVGAGRMRFIAAGEIRPARTDLLAERLECIHARLSELLQRYQPEMAVLEKLFTHHGHVTTSPQAFEAVKQALQSRGFTWESADLTMVPSSTVRVTDPAQEKALLALLDSLEDQDDAQHVYANFDIPDALLAEHAGA